MTNEAPTIAATSTLAMVRTAEARAVATEDILEKAGITRAFLEDPDSRIPAPTVLSIWSELRERTGDPALQLVAPTSLPFGAYRLIEYLIASSATVGDGIRRFVGFFALITETVTLAVEEGGEGYALRLEMTDGRAPPPVYVDYVFAALVGRIRMRIRPALAVQRVELRQPEPSFAYAYREVFRAPIRFGAPANRLCFSVDEWNAPMETADPALTPLLEEHARLRVGRIPRAAPGFRDQVQKTIAAALPEAGSAEVVARALHVSVRTLQRKLLEAGTTFREVYESVREQLAQQYLADPKVSIAEVAFLLGFSDQSSFNRAFRRWTGQSPGRWRRQRA